MENVEDIVGPELCDNPDVLKVVSDDATRTVSSMRLMRSGYICREYRDQVWAKILITLPRVSQQTLLCSWYRLCWSGEAVGDTESPVLAILFTLNSISRLFSFSVRLSGPQVLPLRKHSGILWGVCEYSTYNQVFPRPRWEVTRLHIIMGLPERLEVSFWDLKPLQLPEQPSLLNNVK